MTIMLYDYKEDETNWRNILNGIFPNLRVLGLDELQELQCDGVLFLHAPGNILSNGSNWINNNNGYIVLISSNGDYRGLPNMREKEWRKWAFCKYTSNEYTNNKIILKAFNESVANGTPEFDLLKLDFENKILSRVKFLCDMYDVNNKNIKNYFNELELDDFPKSKCTKYTNCLVAIRNLIKSISDDSCSDTYVDNAKRAISKLRGKDY